MTFIQESLSLALLGGSPAFETPLYVGRPNLGDRQAFHARANQIFDRLWLTNDGPMVKDFEERIAALTGVKYCMAVCNATIALGLAAKALDLHGEVIVPSFTFVATAHALNWLGMQPVFADIDPRTHNLDPASVEEHITARTTGIVGVHLWGRPCNTDALEAVAHRYRLPVLYDAAHAFGCSRHGRKVGGFGACEVFSFHATKFINSFEGGAVTTNDAELAQKISRMRSFGFAGYDNVVLPGTNGKMTEICAAMGITSLEAAEKIVAANLRNQACYQRGLSGLKGISILDYDADQTPNYHYAVAEVDSEQAALNRDELLAVLHRENVLARRYFWPGCHRMEPYRSQGSFDLPATELVASRVLVLPNGTAVGPHEIARVCEILRTALDHAPQVRAALQCQSARGAANCA